MCRPNRSEGVHESYFNGVGIAAGWCTGANIVTAGVWEEAQKNEGIFLFFGRAHGDFYCQKDVCTK